MRFPFQSTLQPVSHLVVHYGDLRSLARPAGTRAVVVGASMAGLLAAQALSDRVDEVWLLDRDALPAGAEHRRATPQSRHAHLLLARGREAIEDLLPGVTAEWAAFGASLPDLQAGIAFHGGSHAFMQALSGDTAVAASRPLLEAAVRRRVLALPNVHAAVGIDVQGLLVDSRGRVNGVQLASVGDEEWTQAFHASLVVDASGRSSRLPNWLRELGHDAPSEDTVPVDLRYMTASFRRGGSDAGNSAAICMPTAAMPRAGIMLAQEGRRWAITLAGYGDDAPPLTMQGFSARALRMPSADIAAVVRDAEPLGDPIGFRFAASRRRRYERLLHLPPGVLAIGDALCSIDPLHGQGMTLAACEAQVLRDVLRDDLRAGDERIAERFFKRASPLLDTPWAMASASHAMLARATEPALAASPLAGRLAARLSCAHQARLYAAAAADPRVARAFLDVVNLKASRASLLRPGVLLRTLRRHTGDDDGDSGDADAYKVRFRTR